MKPSSVLLMLWCASCATTEKKQAPVPQVAEPKLTSFQRSPISLTIVGTNDWHGWVAPQIEKFPKGEIRYGGAALMAGYLNILRAENPDGVVLLDAGDMFQGTLLSNSTEGAVVIAAFNRLKYDAAALGNHEFDYGPEGEMSVATTDSVDAFGALKARINQATFPVLSANTYEKQTQKHPAWLKGDGTALVVRHGVKIGIIGLTTTQTPSTTVPVNVKSLQFNDLTQEALAASARLKSQGAEVIVVTAHAGGKCDEGKAVDDLASCDLESAEIFKMIQALPKGTVDAVVSGHTHSVLRQIVNGVPVIQSWAMGRHFGVINLFVDPVTKKVLPEQTSVEPTVTLCETVDSASKSCDVKSLLKRSDSVSVEPALFHGKPVAVDAAFLADLKGPMDAVAMQQSKSLNVVVSETLWRNHDGESALGSVLADNVRAMEKADVALLNSGGLRADLRPGVLTYGQVYEVLPFDNGISRLELTGAQLEQFLRLAYGSKKGVFQVSGAELELSECVSPQRLKKITLAGKPLVASKKYVLVLPDFLARGGDGLGPAMATLDSKQVDIGESRAKNLRESLVEFWEKRPSKLTVPKLGRIRFLSEKAPCQPVQ